MESIPLPSNLPEVEQLIQQLYQPNPPETISKIQDVLQHLQKSPQGWQLAQGLLARPGDNVKFFGVLTLIVKLNTERVSDSDAVSILQNLVSWLVNSLQDGSGPVVMRKLCSALVTYFIQYSHTWDKCVQHLICCLDLNRYAAIEDIQDMTWNEQLLQTLDTQKFLAATCFVTALAEESEKVDTKSTKFIALHQRLISNIPDISMLLGYGLKPTNGVANIRCQNEAIKCLQAWIVYAQRTPRQSLVAPLQVLLDPVIGCLVVDELYEVAIELLTDTLANWQAFFTARNFNSIYALFERDWSREQYEGVKSLPWEFGYIQFGLFMLALGDAQMVEMMDETDGRAQALLDGLAGLLSAQGHPYVDDKVFVPALDFWSTFVENLVDTFYADPADKRSWNTPPLSQVMRVVTASWQKIQYPPINVYESWDSTEKVGFADVRKDVADFLQVVYPIAGLPLISLFADLMLRALRNSVWAELEALSFCLGALSDCVGEGESCDVILDKIFGSGLFDLLRQGQNIVPVRARQTCLYLIERYSEYFGRHAQFLPAALNLLFSAVGDRHLSLPSSRSIHTLCSSCRSLLTSEVDAFLEQYESLRQSQELDSTAEEKVVGAIAAVVEAIPDDGRKAQATRRLLILVSTDIEHCIRLRESEDGAFVATNDPLITRAYDPSQRPDAPVPASEVSLQLAIKALRSLRSIAKGLQSPVEIESDESNAQISSYPDPLEQVQSDIMGYLIRLRDLFSTDGEVVDAICGVLRAGFSETEPGPFVFTPLVVTSFLIGPWQGRIAAVVNTASAFASSLNFGKSKVYIEATLGQLLPWVFGLLHQLPNPESDPELSQYGIEFATRVLARHTKILMSQSGNLIEFVFVFAMKLLNGSEPLPKGAAADFWTTFITTKADDKTTQKLIDNAMSHLGPELGKSLVRNIGGLASRSDLERIADPLKKLVVQHRFASKWLEAALNDPTFPSDKVTTEDKALFLKRVVNLRGSRTTNQVVRDFWLACRGSNFAYAS